MSKTTVLNLAGKNYQISRVKKIINLVLKINYFRGIIIFIFNKKLTIYKDFLIYNNPPIL